MSNPLHVLVTGAAGFIGAHVTRRLLTLGHTVIALDDFNDFYDPHLKTRNVEPFIGHPRFVLYRSDIRDTEALKSVFEAHQMDAVIHLAARAGVRPSLDQAALYMDVNVTGTVHLADHARQAGINRFIFASSSSVYGDAPDRVPFEETQDVSRPISPYAATKVMAEQMLHALSHLYRMPVFCLRLFTVYGPGQRPDLAIYKFTRLIDADQPLPLYGDGSTRRDYTYVDDIVKGIVAALTCPVDPAQPFQVMNLSGSETTSLLELVRLIEQAVGKPARLSFQPEQAGDVRVTYGNIDKARHWLGYEPTTPVRVGIPRFVGWYRQQHYQHQLTAI